MSNIVSLPRFEQIPFHEDHLSVALIDGEPHVAIRPILEAIGLNVAAQLRKLRSRSWAVVSQVDMTGADGKTYLMSVANLETIGMMLATIDENQVAEHVREKLIAYQCEVAGVIKSYYSVGIAINPRIYPLKEQIEGLKMLAPVIGPDYAQVKGRLLLGRLMGEEAEVDPELRPLIVDDYLKEHGANRDFCRRNGAQFGIALADQYRKLFSKEPPQQGRFINNRWTPVNVYVEKHRALFDAVWNSRKWA